ncbi:polysaccharide deacetylase family protein [Bacillus cereus]|uniref:polysaccharide deacetylase family protein n=1 Tax=Bacillus cereus TaxID=1396 RepID=UPI003D05D8C9
MFIFFTSTISNITCFFKVILNNILFNNKKDLEPTGIVTWNVPTNQKIIAFTFDDGPDIIYTKMILEILEQYCAKATFFMLGNRMQKYPGLVQLVLNKKHEIGNHTMNHIYANNATSQKIQEDALQGQKQISKYMKGAALFRPAGGYVNQTVLTLAKKNKYQIVFWSWTQDPRDWSSPETHVIVKLSTLVPI